MNMCDNKMNRMLPELLAKTKAHQILSFLTLHPDQSFYDKEISERAGVSRGATNQVLNDFFKNNLVIREKRGKAWFYTISDQPIVKHFRIYENLLHLAELVNQLRPIVKRVVLFGSAARGIDTSESDMDLFILADDQKSVSKAVSGFASEREIKPVIMSPVDFAVAQSKDKAFFDQVARGIALYEKEVDEQRL